MYTNIWFRTKDSFFWHCVEKYDIKHKSGNWNKNKCAFWLNSYGLKPLSPKTIFKSFLAIKHIFENKNDPKHRYVTMISLHHFNLILLTINLQFTEFVESVLTIPSRIRWVSPVVVVDNISPVYGTRYVCRIWYCGPGIAGVFKTEFSVFFFCCIRHVNRESQESCGVTIFCIWSKTTFKKRVLSLKNLLHIQYILTLRY